MNMANLWDRAAMNLGEEDRQIFFVDGLDKKKVLQDILLQVQKQSDLCSKRQWTIKSYNGKKLLVRDLCTKLLKWISQFTPAGDTAANFDPGHAALPWAGFRFLLKLCLNDVKAWQSMLEGLQNSFAVVAHGRIVEDLYYPGVSDSHKQLETALIQLYATVLNYLTIARKYFDKSTSKRFIYSNVSLPDLVDVLETIRKKNAHVESLTRLLDAQQHKNISATLSKLDRIVQSVDSLHVDQADLKRMLSGFYTRNVFKVETLHDDLQDSRRLELLRWLSTTLCLQHHKDLRKGLINSTGRWLLSSQEYLDWKSSSRSEIFFLHGIPGCGKTGLVTRVVDELQAGRSATPNAAPLAYFYCSGDSTESDRADPCCILRTIVKQLSYVTVGGSLFQPIRVKYQQCMEEAALHGISPTVLDAEECRSLLDVLTSITSLTIIIDAVDECDAIKRHVLFKVLKRLASQFENVVKIFVSARSEDDVVAQFAGFTSYEITQDRNSADIDRFVKSRVHDAVQEGRLLIDTEDPGFELKVVDALKKGAQGMFLWPHLQIETLCNRRRIKHVADIIAALKQMPSNLSDLYRNIHKQIEDSGSTGQIVATTVFRWLLHAQRTLSIHEMLAAVTRNQDPGDSISIGKMSAQTILNCCGTLVVVDHHLRIFRFIHPSVRQYLETRPEYDPAATHLVLAERCLKAYVSPANELDDPLCKYACMYWGLHCERSSGRSTITELILDFLFEGEYFHDCLDGTETALQKFDEYSEHTAKLRAIFSDPVNPLFAVSCFGLAEVLVGKSQSLAATNLQQTNTGGVSSLYLAARYGHSKVVGQLVDLYLHFKMDLNISGGQFGSALQAASFSGNREIAAILFSRGASISQPGEFPDAIQAALAGGFEQLACFILDTSFKKGEKSNVNTLLNFAAFGGYANIVQSIAQCRHRHHEHADTQAPVQTALFQKRKREALRLLEGMDINAQEGFFGNALQAAICGGSLAIVKLVVGRGARSQRGTFGFPLRTATIFRHESIVQWLLQRGAEVNVEDQELGDCLQAAAFQGHTRIMNLLIDNHADINGRNQGFFGNALQAASFNGRLNSVEILLKKGASLSAPGRFDNATYAAVHGNQEIVLQELLRKATSEKTPTHWLCAMWAGPISRTEPRPRYRKPFPDHSVFLGMNCSPPGLSPLEIATLNGNIRLLKGLLNNGAAVNGRGKKHQSDTSALQLAALRGNECLVRVLLEYGADVGAVGKITGTALHAGLQTSNLSIACMLLAHGANIDQHWIVDTPGLSDGEDYGSPLHVASERGNLKVVKFLYYRGADINRRSKIGTALQIAARAGQSEVVHFLIDSGANVNASGGLDGTAMLAAILGSHYDIADMLSTHIRSINVFFKITGLLETRGLRLFRDPFTNRNIRLTWRATQGTMLQAAAGCGHAEGVQYLLKKRASIDMRRPRGIGAALHLAAHAGHEKIVRILLKSGANPHLTGLTFDTRHSLGPSSSRGLGISRTEVRSKRKVLESHHVFKNSLYTAITQGHATIGKLILSWDVDRFARNGTLREAIKVASQTDPSLAADLVNIAIT